MLQRFGRVVVDGQIAPGLRAVRRVAAHHLRSKRKFVQLCVPAGILLISAVSMKHWDSYFDPSKRFGAKLTGKIIVDSAHWFSIEISLSQHEKTTL